MYMNDTSEAPASTVGEILSAGNDEKMSITSRSRAVHRPVRTVPTMIKTAAAGVTGRDKALLRGRSEIIGQRSGPGGVIGAWDRRFII